MSSTTAAAPGSVQKMAEIVIGLKYLGATRVGWDISMARGFTAWAEHGRRKMTIGGEPRPEKIVSDPCSSPTHAMRMVLTAAQIRGWEADKL